MANRSTALKVTIETVIQETIRTVYPAQQLKEKKDPVFRQAGEFLLKAILYQNMARAAGNQDRKLPTKIELLRGADCTINFAMSDGKSPERNLDDYFANTDTVTQVVANPRETERYLRIAAEAYTMFKRSSVNLRDKLIESLKIDLENCLTDIQNA